MYTDTVTILTFVLQVLKENHKTAFKASSVYDIYRQFHRVIRAADHVLIHYLARHFEDMSTPTSTSTSTFKSVEEKWIHINNENLRNYEAVRHHLMIMLGLLESEEANPKYKRVFVNNCLSKSLPGRIDEHSKLSKIDNSFQLTMYHFNFVTDANKVKPFRSFEKLFREVRFDLSSQEKRDALISETKKQIDAVYDLLKKYEVFMASHFRISDLFLEDTRRKRVSFT